MRRHALTQQVCFSCRKVFKKPAIPYLSEIPVWKQPKYKCPECGANMTHMGPEFRAPRCANIKEWKHIEDSIKYGVEWQVKTIRKKNKAEQTLSPALKKALGFKKAWKKKSARTPNQRAHG